MTIRLDHVTQFVRDRDATAKAYSALGFNATPGGHHKGFGSANNLCYFDLFYIEMLSIHDRDEALNGGSAVCRAAIDFIERGNGLGGVAVEADDLDEAIKSLQSLGAEIGDIVDMQRVQDDGFISRSRIIYPTLPESPVPLPIVIERNVGPADRRNLLSERKVIASHPAGAFTIDSVALVTTDAVAAERIFVEGYGFVVKDRYSDEALGGGCVRLAANQGDVVLCQPAGDGHAMTRLAGRGPGLFAVTFRCSETVQSLPVDDKGFLPLAATDGALIRLIQG